MKMNTNVIIIVGLFIIIFVAINIIKQIRNVENKDWFSLARNKRKCKALVSYKTNHYHK